MMLEVFIYTFYWNYNFLFKRSYYLLEKTII